MNMEYMISNFIFKIPIFICTWVSNVIIIVYNVVLQMIIDHSSLPQLRTVRTVGRETCTRYLFNW